MAVDGFGEDGLTLLDIHMYMKQIFPSMISEDSLNFVAFQLLHCFLEIYLIASPKMKRHGVRKNFMRFTLSSVCLFSYHQCLHTYGKFEYCVPIL